MEARDPPPRGVCGNQEEATMGKFVISPHFRLQEWVAEEKGYFAQEGLDYSALRK